LDIPWGECTNAATGSGQLPFTISQKEKHMKDISLVLFVVFCLCITTNPLHSQWIQTNGPNGGFVACFVVSSTNLFAGTFNGGVFLSTNGTTWAAVNNGLTSTFVTALAVTGTNLIAGTLGGTFLSTNNGAIWTPVISGLTSLVGAFAVNGPNLFAGTFSGVFRSTNNGTTWTPAGLTDTLINVLVVRGPNLFAGTTSYGVFLSTNNGAIWTPVNSGLTSSNISAFAVSGTNLFAGTGGSGGVFRSTNDGTIWTDAGLTNTSIGDLFVSGTNLFAGTFSSGVFLSTNNGTTWTDVNTGLTNTYVVSLVVYGTNLFAGTDSNHVWRRPLSEMITSVERLSTDLPTHFSLEQNYPNPFNPSTTIKYEIPVESRVSLKVFNILGQEVVTLVNEEQKAGYKSVEWNAANVASGVYFYRLQAGDFTASRKLLLLK
jgi:hypothetical protein